MRSTKLWLVEENHATVKPDSSVAPPGLKTYSESRIELQNIQILKKMLENSSQFFVIRAALWAEKLEINLPRELQELKKYPRKARGCRQPRGHLIRVLNERSVNDGWNYCLLWLVILKSVWYGVGDTFKLRCIWPRAVVRYTLLAVVPWNELEHSPYRKARLCVYFNWY